LSDNFYLGDTEALTFTVFTLIKKSITSVFSRYNIVKCVYSRLASVGCLYDIQQHSSLLQIHHMIFT